MAQLVKGLPAKHQDLGVNLQNTRKLPHQMVHTCNLSAKLIPGASWPAILD